MRILSGLLSVSLLLIVPACSVEEIEAPPSPMKINYVSDPDLAAVNKVEWRYTPSGGSREINNMILDRNMFPIWNNGQLNLSTHGGPNQESAFAFNYYFNFTPNEGTTYDLRGFAFDFFTFRNGFDNHYSGFCGSTNIYRAEIIITTLDFTDDRIAGRLVFEVDNRSNQRVKHTINFDIAGAPDGQSVLSL